MTLGFLASLVNSQLAPCNESAYSLVQLYKCTVATPIFTNDVRWPWSHYLGLERVATHLTVAFDPLLSFHNGSCSAEFDNHFLRELMPTRFIDALVGGNQHFQRTLSTTQINESFTFVRLTLYFSMIFFSIVRHSFCHTHCTSIFRISLVNGWPVWLHYR